MHDATMQGSPRKKFNKIRELNRRRNYFTKKVRNALRVGVAKALWDRRRRQPVDLSSAKTVLLMRNGGGRRCSGGFRAGEMPASVRLYR